MRLEISGVMEKEKHLEFSVYVKHLQRLLGVGQLIDEVTTAVNSSIQLTETLVMRQ